MPKRKKPSYYAVRVGRKPGIYKTWKECEEQVSKFSGAAFKGFDTHSAALSYVGDAIATNQDSAEDEEVSVSDSSSASRRGSNSFSQGTAAEIKEDVDFVPPASQSYFDQFPNFEPDNNASFDDEFSRFASSQGIVAGSQEYRKQRTKAIRDELKFHYSSQPNHATTLEAIPELSKDSLSEQEKLDIYQNMCREIGVEPGDTIAKCRRELKKVLVNIVDYIDARRVPDKKIEVWSWSDFNLFSEYSLQDGKRIDRNEAKADGGFLSALLQTLTRSGPRRGRGPAATSASDFRSKRKRVGHDEPSSTKRVRISIP